MSITKTVTISLIIHPSRLVMCACVCAPSGSQKQLRQSIFNFISFQFLFLWLFLSIPLKSEFRTQFVFVYILYFKFEPSQFHIRPLYSGATTTNRRFFSISPKNQSRVSISILNCTVFLLSFSSILICSAASVFLNMLRMQLKFDLNNVQLNWIQFKMYELNHLHFR